MRIDFKLILKTFVMDFRDNGFPIDGKSILIDGDPWELNPGSDMFICSYRFKRSKHNDGIETLPF